MRKRHVSKPPAETYHCILCGLVGTEKSLRKHKNPQTGIGCPGMLHPGRPEDRHVVLGIHNSKMGSRST